MIILLADERDIIKYVTQPDPRVYDYIKGIHKPTTIIYEGAVGLAPNLTTEQQHCHPHRTRPVLQRSRQTLPQTRCFHLRQCFGLPRAGCFTDIDIEIKTVLTTLFNTARTTRPRLYLLPLSNGMLMAHSTSFVPKKLPGSPAPATRSMDIHSL